MYLMLVRDIVARNRCLLVVDLMMAVSIWICVHTASLCEATCHCCCQVLCILVPFYVFGTVLLDRSDLVFGAAMADSAGRGCEPKWARSEWRSGHPRSNPRRRWESFVHERRGSAASEGSLPLVPMSGIPTVFLPQVAGTRWPARPETLSPEKGMVKAAVQP